MIIAQPYNLKILYNSQLIFDIGLKRPQLILKEGEN